MPSNRFERLIDSLKRHGLTQILVTSPSSIFHLTGKFIEPGERLLTLYVNTSGTRRLFINALFPVEEDLGVELCVFNDREDPLAQLAQTVSVQSPLGIEKTWPCHFLLRLVELCSGLECRNGSRVIDTVRMIKDAEEIRLMRQASAINDAVMGDLVGIMAEQRSEKEYCRLMADLYEKRGAAGCSFNPLICFGAGAAEPHHESDGTTVKRGDSIILDIGGLVGHYCSDMTRTFFWREVSDRGREVYQTVFDANQAAIETVRPGARFCDIDAAARRLICERGYGDFFTHRTGHNIGIDVHEFPDVGEVNEMSVEPGMVFSIEPGIYLSGVLGVRIEDLVLVTENGCEVLNRYPKELRVL
jgi:Xaa-Pro dipeptidase